MPRFFTDITVKLPHPFISPYTRCDKPIAAILPINSSSDVESNESRVNSVILLCIPSAAGHELCALSKKRTCRTRSLSNCVICI